MAGEILSERESLSPIGNILQRSDGRNRTITEEDISLFDEVYQRNRADIDQHLESVLQEYEQEDDLYELFDHAIRGGKRIRPMLALTVAEVCGLARERALDHAAIVEFIHNATLVADDYVDDTKVRRNAPTLWRIVERLPFVGPEELHPRTFTLLAENGLLTIALQLPQTPDEVKAMGEAVCRVFHGFYKEACPAGICGASHDSYIEVNREKTGSLFALACELPAIRGRYGSDVEGAAREYGQQVGILYQVADDICDGDFPDFIDNSHDELQKWYGSTVHAVGGLPVTSWEEQWLLETAPVWCVSRMMKQEDRVDTVPEFEYSFSRPVESFPQSEVGDGGVGKE